MKDQTCAERIQDQFNSRNSDIEELMDKVHNQEDDYEEAQEELDNLPLDIQHFKVVKILLSTGGPADWVEARLDSYGMVVNMTYHFQDWFDHASIEVPSNSYVWDYVLQLVDILEFI